MTTEERARLLLRARAAWQDKYGIQGEPEPRRRSIVAADPFKVRTSESPFRKRKKPAFIRDMDAAYGDSGPPPQPPGEIAEIWWHVTGTEEYAGAADIIHMGIHAVNATASLSWEAYLHSNVIRVDALPLGRLGFTPLGTFELPETLPPPEGFGALPWAWLPDDQRTRVLGEGTIDYYGNFGSPDRFFTFAGGLDAAWAGSGTEPNAAAAGFLVNTSNDLYILPSGEVYLHLLSHDYQFPNYLTFVTVSSGNDGTSIATTFFQAEILAEDESYTASDRFIEAGVATFNLPDAITATLPIFARYQPTTFDSDIAGITSFAATTNSSWAMNV